MGVRTWIGSLFLVVSLWAYPSYSQSNNERLIVRFKEGITSFSADTIHKSLGIKSQRRLTKLGSIEVIELPKRLSTQEAIKLYEKNSTVLYAEPDFMIRVKPIKSQFAKQWALDNKGQKVGKYMGKADADINGPESWEFTKGDREVVLGVIDTGIFYKHPDLIRNMWNNPGEIPDNKKDDDENGFVDDVYGINAVDRSGDPLDDNGHGTHCSGIMGGSNEDGKGVFGINQKVSIIGCKFLDSEGSGRMSDALVCMDYFAKLKVREENPVNIVAINASWGGGGYSKAMYDAIKVLRDNGILFVAAAGNDGDDNDRVSSFPANYKLANIISVAATNNKDELAYFSNYGRRSVHVGAPGMDILSTFLDGKYETFSGTSMATPYVTGLIGLLKANDPDLGWKQLKNLVIAGGTKLSALSKKTISGRRIRAADEDGKGSLTCSNQTAYTRILPAESTLYSKVGDAIEFSVLKIKCGEPDEAPSMAVNMGHAVDFTDAEQIGVYLAEWKPDSPGDYDFDLGDGEKVSVTVRK